MIGPAVDKPVLQTTSLVQTAGHAAVSQYAVRADGTVVINWLCPNIHTGLKHDAEAGNRVAIRAQAVNHWMFEICQPIQTSENSVKNTSPAQAV